MFLIYCQCAGNESFCRIYAHVIVYLGKWRQKQPKWCFRLPVDTVCATVIGAKPAFLNATAQWSVVFNSFSIISIISSTSWQCHTMFQSTVIGKIRNFSWVQKLINRTNRSSWDKGNSEFENLKRRELKHERKCPAVDYFATNSHLLLIVTFSFHSHHDAESAKMIGK